MQAHTTLLTNNMQHCWAQHVVSVCVEPQQCWYLLRIYSLKSVKLLGPCKRTQYCWPKTTNNTQQCCDLLRPFAWALTLNVLVDISESGTQYFYVVYSYQYQTRSKFHRETHGFGYHLTVSRFNLTGSRNVRN